MKKMKNYTLPLAMKKVFKISYLFTAVGCKNIRDRWVPLQKNIQLKFPSVGQLEYM